MSDHPQVGPEQGGWVSFPDRAGFADTAGDQRRRAKRRAKRTGLDDTTELNLVPIMGLFTAIVLYLLKSYSADPVQINPDIHVPESNSTMPPQETLLVAISQEVILVGDTLVARVNNGRVSAEYKKDKNPAQLFIVPLYDALKAGADRQKLIARYNKKKKELEFKGLLTIIGDRRIPFRLLTEVLYTAGQAEFGSYKFAVIRREG